MHLRAFLVSIVVTVVCDLIWIGIVANRFYLEKLGDLARQNDGKLDVVYWAAAGVYVLLGLGTVMFVLPLAQGKILNAFVYGALLGLIVYGVYDLTNHATLRNWPLALVGADMLWGTLLCGTAGAIAAWAD